MPVPYSNTISPADMPEPDKIVNDRESGMFWPVMFHYCAESCRPREIAAAYGFDICFEELLNSPHIYPPTLGDWYEGGKLKEVLIAWLPISPGEGWKLCGMNDSDDGPVATFLRKQTPSLAEA